LNLDVIADGVALVAAGQARVCRIERRLLFEPFEGRPLGNDTLDACRIDIFGDNAPLPRARQCPLAPTR
ncbi:MAG: hypothetical protein WBQ20_16225, partial [Methyloceanibacter sp.]